MIKVRVAENGGSRKRRESILFWLHLTEAVRCLFQNATYLQEKAGQLIKRRYSGR